MRRPELRIPDPELVTDQTTLEAHCKAWRAAGTFAFDTEFIRDDTYDATLCLIQVHGEDGVVLIDPVDGIDASPFWELVADPSIVTIVHAGKEDFEVCLRSTGLIPRNIFDVQIAAGFVGHGYPLSLVHLVELLMRRRIAKGQTLTDWLRRPLTEAQIRYATEDVLYLPDVYRKLSAQIAKAKRTAWLTEELRCFEEESFYRVPTEDRALRLKGSRRLDGLGLLVLERLVEWREAWARTKNRPIRAMMRDDVLVEIARRRPKKQSDLEVMRGFPQARNRKVTRELLAIIEEVSETPKNEWPKPRERHEDSPMTKIMLDLLSAVTQAICFEERLSRNLLGSTQRLRDLLEYHAGRGEKKPELLTGWRGKFIGKRLVEILEGRSEIHVSGWPDELKLDIISGGRRSKRAASS